MRRRDLTSFALLLLLLTLAVGLAWLTRHPDSPLLDRAARLPGVGRLAERFRASYLGPRDAPGPATGGEGPPPPSIIVIAPDLDALEARPRVWVPAGSALHPEPAEGSAVVDRVAVDANLPKVASDGDWVLVRLGGREGWVRLAPEVAREPPLGSAPEPVLPLPGRPADPRLLAAGRELLGPAVVAGRLGPYVLYTDLAEPGLLERLGSLAAGVDGVYRARLGLVPVGEALESVLLFAREADYRRLQDLNVELGGLPASGHATSGLVALYREGLSAAQVEATLVHELVHLLNRRSLGPALPPWLDEGLADDLALCRVDAAGRLLPGSLGGEEVVRDGVLERRGGRAVAALVGEAEAAGRTLPLPRLLDLGWRDFTLSEDRELHYSQSFSFVRWLLSGGDASLADGFRSFLAGVAAGGPATPEELGHWLALPWSEIEGRWRAWVRLSGLAAGA